MRSAQWPSHAMFGSHRWCAEGRWRRERAERVAFCQTPRWGAAPTWGKGVHSRCRTAERFLISTLAGGTAPRFGCLGRRCSPPRRLTPTWGLTKSNVFRTLHRGRVNIHIFRQLRIACADAMYRVPTTHSLLISTCSARSIASL